MGNSSHPTINRLDELGSKVLNSVIGRSLDDNFTHIRIK